MPGRSIITHGGIQFSIPYFIVMVLHSKLSNIIVDMLSTSGCIGVYAEKHRNDVAGQKRSIHRIVTTDHYTFNILFFPQRVISMKSIVQS